MDLTQVTHKSRHQHPRLQVTGAHFRLWNPLLDTDTTFFPEMPTVDSLNFIAHRILVNLLTSTKNLNPIHKFYHRREV